jgi:hypothetical protein
MQRFAKCRGSYLPPLSLGRACQQWKLDLEVERTDKCDDPIARTGVLSISRRSPAGRRDW